MPLGAWMAALGQWRLAYVLIALASLVAGLAVTLLRIDESAAEPHPAPPGEGADTATSNSRWPATGQHTLGLHQRAGASTGLWLLFGAMLLGGLNYRCLVTALPAYLTGPTTDAAALSKGGALAFLVLAMGGIGQLVGGHAADRWQPSRLYVLLIAATVPLALVMAHAGQPTPVVAAGMLAIFMFGQQPVENILLAQATSAHNRSMLYGVKFTLSFGLGALGTYLVGVIWERRGSLAPAFDLFAVSALAMAVCAVLFRLSRTRALPQHVPAAPLQA